MVQTKEKVCDKPFLELGFSKSCNLLLGFLHLPHIAAASMQLDRLGRFIILFPVGVILFFIFRRNPNFEAFDQHLLASK